MGKIWRWYMSMSFMVKMTGGFLIGILLGIDPCRQIRTVKLGRFNYAA